MRYCTMNSEYAAFADERILVTGSSGFIGVKVVETLLEYGFSRLRCFVRPSRELRRLRKAVSHFGAGRNFECVTGDLFTRADCREAVDGASLTHHLVVR